MMLLYNQNDALMCKVFPSSLRPTTLRRFNGLRKGSIHNFGELIQEFGARFMTCSQVPQLVDVLLSMKMGLEKLFGAMLTVIRNCIMKFVLGGGQREGGGQHFQIGASRGFEVKGFVDHPRT